MIKNDTLFFDIDTQYDFLELDGRLYVEGAEEIIDRISEARRFALENGYSILATVDWHSLEDEEISTQPDYNVTWPPHCMAGERGAQRLGYLGELPIEYVGPEAAQGNQLLRMAERGQFHIVIRTSTVDAFENPNTLRLLEAIGAKRMIVFGVALDICVNNAVRGLIEWGRTETIVLNDAVKGLGTQKDEDVYARFREGGVRIMTLAEAKGML